MSLLIFYIIHDDWKIINGNGIRNNDIRNAFEDAGKSPGNNRKFRTVFI